MMARKSYPPSFVYSITDLKKKETTIEKKENTLPNDVINLDKRKKEIIYCK